MRRLSRRHALTAALAAGAGAIASCAPKLGAKTAVPSPLTPGVVPMPTSLAGDHTLVPLPFAPTSLTGISEKLIVSHHDNNYAGAVKNLNRVEQELGRIDKDTPPFIVAALRDKELTFRNSKNLHEAYFANLGGDGKRSGAIETALGQAYGTSARWEEHARATAMGLGGGSGWVILAFELDTGMLRTVGAGNHTQVLATSVPLLVLDMYEHGYQMDFGAAVAKYLDAFFANVKWDEVNRRFERAGKASAALRA